MKELRQIFETWSAYKSTGKKAALATVVSVEGSAYRRQGARMLIMEDGKWKGSISGGCLEGDALKKAKKIMDGTTSQLLTYDTTEEGAHDLYLGLGCHGRIEILLEPLNENDSMNPLTFINSFFEKNEEAILATITESEKSFSCKRYLFYPDEALSHDWKVYADGFYHALETGKSLNYTFEEDNNQIKIFFEYLNPGIELYIFGAGFDVVPLSEFSKVLGWKVAVYDDCIAHLSPMRIPKADSLNMVDFCSIPNHFTPGRFAAALVMSHNYKFDIKSLRFLLDKNIAYVGLMGPKARFVRMLEDDPALAAYQNNGRLFSPVGLDIGAESPEEIALAITGEIKSFFAGRSGNMLKERLVPIHERKKALHVKIEQI
jgi:xanthine dehydrogenase accessory factor